MRYILKPIDDTFAQQLYEIVDTKFGGHRLLARVLVPGTTHELSKVLTELNSLDESNQRMSDLVTRLEREADSSNMFHGGID